MLQISNVTLLFLVVVVVAVNGLWLVAAFVETRNAIIYQILL